MTLYLENPPGTFTPWHGDRIDGIAYPLSLERKWSAAELAAISLYKPSPADPAPEGKQSVGMHVARVDGTVQFVRELEDVPPPPVPQDVTARQARLALNAAGLRQQVEDAVGSAGQDVQDFWEYSITIGRQHPILLDLATNTLGMTEQEIDDLFLAAGQL
ncbi:MAG: hypothetical protein RLO11_00215 [Salinisphaeraceae bacterium]